MDGPRKQCAPDDEAGREQVQVPEGLGAVKQPSDLETE